MIINGDTLTTTEDKEVEIKCVSRGGKPAAEVRKFLGFYFEVYKFIICFVS